MRDMTVVSDAAVANFSRILKESYELHRDPNEPELDAKAMVDRIFDKGVQSATRS